MKSRKRFNATRVTVNELIKISRSLRNRIASVRQHKDSGQETADLEWADIRIGLVITSFKKRLARKP